MLRLREILVVIVLAASLVANAWLANDRLEKKFYQRGVKEGKTIVANQVINQVEKTGRLLVTVSSGKQIALQVVVPEAPPLAPIPPGVIVEPLRDPNDLR